MSRPPSISTQSSISDTSVSRALYPDHHLTDVRNVIGSASNSTYSSRGSEYSDSSLFNSNRSTQSAPGARTIAQSDLFHPSNFLPRPGHSAPSSLNGRSSISGASTFHGSGPGSLSFLDNHGPSFETLTRDYLPQQLGPGPRSTSSLSNSTISDRGYPEGSMDPRLRGEAYMRSMQERSMATLAAHSRARDVIDRGQFRSEQLQSILANNPTWLQQRFNPGGNTPVRDIQLEPAANAFSSDASFTSRMAVAGSQHGEPLSSGVPTPQPPSLPPLHRPSEASRLPTLKEHDETLWSKYSNTKTDGRYRGSPRDAPPSYSISDPFPTKTPDVMTRRTPNIGPRNTSSGQLQGSSVPSSATPLRGASTGSSSANLAMIGIMAAQEVNNMHNTIESSKRNTEIQNNFQSNSAKPGMHSALHASMQQNYEKATEANSSAFAGEFGWLFGGSTYGSMGGNSRYFTDLVTPKVDKPNFATAYSNQGKVNPNTSLSANSMAMTGGPSVDQSSFA